MDRKRIEKGACRDKGRFWKGSYTVEAAAVLSVTFFVLGALILCTFYLHDRAVCQSAACEAAAAGSNFATEKERSRAAASVKKQLNKGRLLGSRNVKSSTTAGTKESLASWSAEYPIPGFAIRYFSGNQRSISVSWTCRIPDPADTIRKIRGAAGLITGGGP